MKLVIPVGESREFPGQGAYFWIAAASGPLIAEVTNKDGDRSTHKINSRFQLRVDGGVRSIRLTNAHSTTNTVEADTGIGEMIPSGDGQKVNLTGSDVTLEVEGKAGGVPMAVTGPATDAQMRASALQVQIEGQDVSLQVHTIPGDTLTTPAPLTPTVGGTAIAANAAREEVTLYAPSANLLPVWIGSASGQGIPLEPGKFVSLKTTAAIPLFAGNGTDTVTFLEVQ